MGVITLELIRKRAEHNEGEIRTLEELALHQERITKIENLDKWCRQLKILLLQNNLIQKIENLSRLKSLTYINLAMNNIEIIEGLDGCENLKKLDLTLNFIGQISTAVELRKNYFLDQLYLVGNPCTDYQGYRDYVVSLVPQIMFLDGVEITKSERIKAKQNMPALKEQMNFNEGRHFVKREIEKNQQIPDTEDDEKFWNTPSPNTPEVRTQIQQKIEKDEEKKKPKPNKPEKKPRRMFSPSGRAYNVNEGKYPFSLNDETDRGILVLDVSIPRHMDTSLIQIDMQPLYVKLVIKGKLFQLTLPEEVKPDDSFAQRSQITGHLVITMPKFDQSGIIQFWKGDNKPKNFEAVPSPKGQGVKSEGEPVRSKSKDKSQTRKTNDSNTTGVAQAKPRKLKVIVNEDEVPPLV